jgi:amino acid transporter/nucleotide-binding universal stress UspA family protein
MIGAGIFVLPGPGTAMAGPAIAISFFIGGLVAMLTALTASELGTAMPKAGGGYFFVNKALGPIFGSVVGWGNWMGLAFASAFYAIGFGSYMTGWLPLPELSLGVMKLAPEQLGALGAGGFFIAVNYIGAKETGRLQNIIVVTLVGILAVFIVSGVPSMDLGKMQPIAPEGWDAVLPATALVFVSFLGFAKITTVAEEIREPGKNLPLAIIGSVAMVTIIYVIVLVMMTSVTDTPLNELGEVAVVEVGRKTLGVTGVIALTVGGLLATASSANASILASSRINFAMGRDGLVSNWLNDIHERFATPHRSILVTGIAILLFIVIGDIKVLAKAGSVLHLIVYGCINISLLVMRTADPDDYNPDFRVPFYPITPILGAITSFGLIAFMAPIEIMLSVAFVVGGIAWYLLYARHHTNKQGVLTNLILSRSGKMPDSAVQAAKAVRPEGSGYRVMVPLANPKSEKNLITLASALAKRHGGTVVAVHIVQVPDQLALEAGAEHVDELDQESQQLLDRARQDAATMGVPVETHTILSHRGFDEIFDAAVDERADEVVLGWGPEAHGDVGRVEGTFDSLLGDLPCDFVLFKDRGFQPERLLIPTAGGPDSDVSADVAHALAAEFDSTVTFMHVVGDEIERSEGEQFLGSWAEDHDFGDAQLDIVVGDNPYETIREHADEHTMLIVGATERGLIDRLTNSGDFSRLVNDAPISVMLAEKAHDRSLRQRLFGTDSDRELEDR